MDKELIFQKASILCYRLFDIAEEIHLENARRLLAEGTRRLKLSREGSEYLQLPNPPLGIELGKRSLATKENSIDVEVTARLFDHGAASIILAVPVPAGTGMERLIALSDELYDSASIDALSQECINTLRQQIAQSLQGAHLWSQNESYTIIFAEALEGSPTSRELLSRADLARLLLGEVRPTPLSERESYEVTQHRFSYTENDLVVVDWNSAFVYEPSGSRDIPDVLEICNAQLLELRYYDDLLDMQLARIYDEVHRRKRTWRSIFRSPYNVLARRVLATLMEISEFIERVENSLKIIGDFYLAKVYEAGVKRLRIASWQASVTRKQQMLANVYQLLKGDVDTQRSLTLEATIVVLIVSEIIVGAVALLW